LLPDTFGSPENAFWVGAFATVFLTGIYTVFGGMRAIMATAAPQAVIVLFGSFVITTLGLLKLADGGGVGDGWVALVDTVKLNSDQFALWRPLSDPDFPWLGVLIALPMHTVGGVETINGDTVFPTLVATLLPSGIRGLIVACLLAALMSSMASLFNSSAPLFTVDIYEKIRPGRSAKHLLFVGRAATAVVVVLGLLWIPAMKTIAGGGLYQYLQSVQGYLAPPITAVFLLGLFWKRLNATGILFIAAVALMVGGSLLSAPPPAEKTTGLTYHSIRELHGEEIRASWDAGNKLLATLILMLVAGLYLYFSFWLN
jgi:SSS family solute:Na+ symporter